MEAFVHAIPGGQRYKIVTDVYFSRNGPAADPSICTVEILTVDDHSGNLSLLSHEVSPLECMRTPTHRRRSRYWHGHKQKYIKVEL